MKATSGVILLAGLALGLSGCGLGSPSAEDVRILRKLAYLRGAVILMRDGQQEAALYREVTSSWDVPMAAQVMLQDRKTRRVYPPTPRPDSPGPFKVVLVLVRVDAASGQPRFGCVMGFPPVTLDNLDLLVPPDAGQPER